MELRLVPLSGVGRVHVSATGSLQPSLPSAMMKACLDASAFAKRFVEEHGSDSVDAVCAQASELGLSVLCLPEVVSALDRRLREGLQTQRQYCQPKQCLLDDVRDADIIQLTPAADMTGQQHTRDTARKLADPQRHRSETDESVLHYAAHCRIIATQHEELEVIA